MQAVTPGRWHSMTNMSPAHMAVELSDLDALRELLDAGADIHEEQHGQTLLHHAIDVEIDGHTQTGDPLHVDTTAYLLARGADPRRRSEGGHGVTAEHMAFVRRHWLATSLIEEWLRSHPEGPVGA
ncbi:ankyrin repeat domain-containing protein [Sphaerisporangium sp. NPDC051011]|uniref:ankyrin repeat domain-containing protein n=1 Tax=Sphaerisporangium sp. NPDC051011 TaxID=3155792 RepID=UPI0033CEBEE6